MTEIQLLNRNQTVEKTGGISIKIIILWVFGVVAAFGVGWYLKSFFETSDWNFLIWASSAAVVFLIVLFFQVLFVREKGALAFAIFLESVAMVAIFIPKSIVVLSFAVVLFIVFFWGSRRARSILKNSLKIDFWGASRPVLSKGIIGIALLFGGLLPFYLNASEGNFPVSPFLFEEIIDSGGFIIKKFLPGFTSTSTIEEIALKTSQSEINKMPGAYNFPKETRQELLNQGVSQFYLKISDVFGIKINPKLNIPETFYNWARDRFLVLSDTNKKVFLAGIGLLVFVTIEAVSMPLRLAIALFAFIIYEILMALGFANIEFEEKSKEIIVI